jgi:putative hemolysin
VGEYLRLWNVELSAETLNRMSVPDDMVGMNTETFRDPAANSKAAVGVVAPETTVCAKD